LRAGAAAASGRGLTISAAKAARLQCATHCRRPVMSDSVLVEVNALSKRVRDAQGELTILHELSFSLQAHTSVAIVGASGSGKSTLLGLLAGLDTPSSGSVRIQGQELFALNEDERAALRARVMGFVFQSFQLLPNLTALENVMLPLELRGEREAADQARQMLQRVGLGERLNHRPRVLSGGEQQRVALARAFVVKPALLLADEPTGSLDHATGAQVMELMFELNRAEGTTLVLVTHDPAVAARCERQLKIEAGRLVS